MIQSAWMHVPVISDDDEEEELKLIKSMFLSIMSIQNIPNGPMCNARLSHNHKFSC